MALAPLRIGVRWILVGVLCVVSVVEADRAHAAPVLCVYADDANPYEQLGVTQTPPDADLGGIRAPIETRKDGVVCDDNNDNLVAEWIGINDHGKPTDFGHITQVGFIYIWRHLNLSASFCRFWAVGVGTPQVYGCGAQTDNDFVSFEVAEYPDQFLAGQNDYAIYDCGTDRSYINCTAKNVNVPARGYQLAAAVAESSNAGAASSACRQRITGTGSDRDNIGSNEHLIQIVPDPGGSHWGTPNMDPYDNAFLLYPDRHRAPYPKCGHYHKNQPTNGVVTTWDDRNAS